MNTPFGAAPRRALLSDVLPDVDMINPLHAHRARSPSVLVKPSVPTLAEWMSRTSIRFRIRGDGMKKLDQAFANYLASGQANPILMLNALDEYLRLKGGEWRRVDRNQASGGMLQRLHEQLIERLHVERDRGLDEIQRVLVPESRFGFLYLSGQMRIDMNGVGLMGQWLATEASLAHAEVFATLGDEHQVGKIGEMAVTATKISGAVSGTATLASVATSYVSSTHAASTKGPDREVHLRKHPALTRQAGFRSLPLHTRELGGETEGRLASLMARFQTFGHAAMQFFHKVGAALEKAGTAIARTYRVYEGTILKILNRLVRFILCQVLEASVPFLGDALKLGSALVKTIDQSITATQLWIERTRFSFNTGHPEMMAKAVEQQLHMGMGEGLLDALKSAGALTASVFVPGTGAIVNGLVNGIKWITVAIKRLVEQSRIDTFLGEMAHIWKKESTLVKRNAEGQMQPDMDKSSTSLIHQPEAFNELFKRGCNASALIPMLALNSGICGNMMTYLKMANDSSTGLIGQAAFDAGDRYFTRIKCLARDYMRSADFMFRGDTPHVQRLIDHAVNDHAELMTTRSRVVAAIAG